MSLTTDEENYVKQLYEKNIKLKRITELESEMWDKVKPLKEKEDWEGIQIIKENYYRQINEIKELLNA